MTKKASETAQEAQTKRGRGRPSSYDLNVAKAICERLEKGEVLVKICEDDGMPSARTVYDWMEKHEEFSSLIARARVIGYDVIAAGTMAIADEMPPAGPDGKTDSGYVAWQKNRIWTRQQLLAKWDPKRYGELKQIEHSGKISLESLVSDEE